MKSNRFFVYDSLKQQSIDLNEWLQLTALNLVNTALQKLLGSL